MERRRVGRSELYVSCLGLGGWRTLGDQLDQGQSHALLDAARDGGINLIDLADAYADGAAERVVGAWLKHQRREEFIITSKVFWPTGPAPDDRGLGRRHILQAIDRSLRNLGCDYLDVYFCHREDPDTPLSETASVMDELVRAGKIRHWGTSVWHPKRLLKTHALTRLKGQTPPRVEQPSYNLLERSVERVAVPVTRLLGMGLFIYSPLAEGLLTGKYADGVTPPDSRAARDEQLRARLNSEIGKRAARFAHLAKAHGLAPATLALAWLLGRPNVSSVLVGASSVLQLQENLKAATLQIPAELLLQLESFA